MSVEILCPRDIKILVWCPASMGSLTSWQEGASLALVDHPSSDVVTIKIHYGIDVLLHRPASHPHCLKLNLTLLLDRLRLA